MMREKDGNEDTDALVEKAKRGVQCVNAAVCTLFVLW
jgi:hypothetical protein